MDFLAKKESHGLISDLKSSEIAINAEKENFQKKLLEQYGKEMESAFENNPYVPMQITPSIKTNNKSEKKKETKTKKCWLKRLFSI